MTREEMIEQLENMILLIRQNGKDWWDERDIPILEEVIKSMQTEPCEDTISRQTILDKIKEVCFSKEWIEYRVNYGSNGTRDYLISFIENLPSVQPAQKVLKKIKAEIEHEANSCNIIMGEDEDAYEWGKHNAYTHVLFIIDKYMAESEDKECE